MSSQGFDPAVSRLRDAAMITLGSHGFPAMGSSPAWKGNMAIISPGNSTDECYGSGTVTSGMSTTDEVYESVSSWTQTPTASWTEY